MFPPKTIEIKSDDNELEFIGMVNSGSNGVKLNEPLYQYQYSKSVTKKGEKLFLTKDALNKLMTTQNDIQQKLPTYTN